MGWDGLRAASLLLCYDEKPCHSVTLRASVRGMVEEARSDVGAPTVHDVRCATALITTCTHLAPGGRHVNAGTAFPVLPVVTLAGTIEPARIHRAAALIGARTAWVTTRPFRAPHHTILDAGLIGGGNIPMPGEVSLAHHGVLFLDELPEFRRHVLEVLRKPLEDDVTSLPSPACH